MRRKTILCTMLAAVFTLGAVSGCGAQAVTIEYGEDVDLAKLLEVEEDTAFSLTPDVNIIGTYRVRWADGTQEKRVQVTDSQAPQIELYQEADAKLLKGDSYDPKANIRAVSDPIDGDLKGAEVLEEEAYRQKLQDAQRAHDDLEAREFETQDEVSEAKKAQEDQSFVILRTNIDTETVGAYQVEVAACDRNGNISRKTFQVEVVDEKETIKDEETAIGSSKRPKGEEEKAETTPKKEETSQSQKQEESAQKNPSQGSQSSSSKPSADSAAPAISDPVAKAALARVGQQLSCDDLVSYALMDAGRISGGDNWMGTVGVYYFPTLCTQIPASQARQGDLVYYSDGGAGSPHIAVYLGGGEAVHGGYNGLNVVRTTVNLGGGPTYYLRFPQHLTWDEIDYLIFGDPLDSSPEETTPQGDRPQSDSSSSTIYTTSYSVGDVSVTVESSSPIDDEKVMDLVQQVFFGEITYEQMTQQLQGMGYRVL